MKIKKNDKKLDIFVKYESSKEWRKMAKQKRVRLAMKSLESARLIVKTEDEVNRTIRITCKEPGIYYHILKGLKSVGGKVECI